MEDFVPLAPTQLEAAGLVSDELESLILKFLLHIGSATGVRIADQVALPVAPVFECLLQMKLAMLLAYKGSSDRGDFVYELTASGQERAKRHAERCQYFSAAPVPLAQYAASVEKQSHARQRVGFQQLKNAFGDLFIKPEVLGQLGEAITAGKGMFLYGPPGNGKTSIAERITKAFGELMWIPRTISVNGELIRLFDPGTHQELSTAHLAGTRLDRRWVLIRRPTIIVGGELTLDNLDIRHNGSTGILEAPIHLKSNGGTLVVDDFGRQRISTSDLLNRWIVPLEKRVDYLNLPSGRQVEVPFAQLLVLSTNLDPRKLLDEAFLRRVPYKIEVKDPTENEFRELFRVLSWKMGVRHCEEAVNHLIETHYKRTQRAFRYCHVRDLLLQVIHRCRFLDRPAELTVDHLESAVTNYFGRL